jgi:hypothetical protein
MLRVSQGVSVNRGIMRRILIVLLPLTLGAAGCQQTLFSNSDPYNASRVRRYWDDDSAKEARAARQRAQEMGFGFNTGGGDQ